jgi:transposase
VDDSTLGDLFHRTAEIVEPLYERLLNLIAGKEIVLADETTQRVQAKGKTRTAWLWSFIARDEVERELIAYVFSRSRSGDTPVEVLGETKGKLVADAYSGYNKVTTPGGRERAGCLARNRAMKVLAELHPARARHLVVLPRALLRERDAGLGRLAVHVGEQAVHAQPVAMPSDRQQGRAEDAEAVVDPLRGLDDPPPAFVLGRDGSLMLILRASC